MTFDDDIKKHQAFIDGINNYVNECLDNKVSIDKIEQTILNIVREQIKKRNAKN